MTIKTSTFGRVELIGNEAARFRRHMTEDKPNPQAQASLVRGRAILRQMTKAFGGVQDVSESIHLRTTQL